MRKLKYVKLFENFLTKLDIKKGDKVTIKKERLLDGSKSNLSLGVEYTGFLKDDIERNKPIILIDDKGNKIMNTSPITKFEYQKSLVMTNTSIYSIKKEENSNKPNKIPNKPKKLKIISSKHGLDIYIEPVEVKIGIWWKKESEKVIKYKYLLRNEMEDTRSFGGRSVVLVNINGLRVPFYKSSGQITKEGIIPGNWYNIWGITANPTENDLKDTDQHKVSWYNKGSSGFDGNIYNFYNIELFKKIANRLNELDSWLKTLDDEEDFIMYLTTNGLSQINADMKPALYKDRSLDENHIENFKKKLISVLPEEHKKLVKMGSDF